MTVSPQPCPECGEPVRRFRSVPGRIKKIFKFRLYECHKCDAVIETVEVAHRIQPAEQSKRYISRVESSREKEQRKEKKDGGTTVVYDGERIDADE